MDWISIEDRLPDFEEKVFVCEENVEDSLKVCILNSKTEYADTISYEWLVEDSYDDFWHEVTHWMPLPKVKIT